MRYRDTTRLRIENTHKSTFYPRMIICIIILITLSVIKLTPNENFTKVKNAVSLILNKETKINQELEKVKGFFKEEEGLSAMSPVSEFLNPAKGGEVVKGFGVQDADSSGFHYGVDIKLPENSNVVSVAKGEVTEVATNEEYGTYIVIKHSDEISTLYAGLNEVLPSVSEKVESGQVIARPNEENHTIHFEVKRQDTYLDPAEFINFGEGND